MTNKLIIGISMPCILILILLCNSMLDGGYIWEAGIFLAGVGFAATVRLIFNGE